MLEFRQRGTNDPLYCADRDIAHIFSILAGGVPSVFTSEHVMTWIASHIQTHQLTEGKLQAATQAYFTGLESFLNPDVKSVAEAFQASGFWNRPEAERLAVFAAVGLIVTNFYYKSVRDAYCPGVQPLKPILATERTLDAIEIGKKFLDNLQPTDEEFTRALMKEGGAF